MKIYDNLETTTLIPTTNSTYQDFTQSKAIQSRGTKGEDKKKNFLTIDQQISLIHDIFMRCYSVKVDGKKEILLDLKKGKVQYIERNYTNFSTLIKMTFREITDSKGFESVNLPKLFELIKSKKTYSFRKTSSIFLKDNVLKVDDKNEELVLELKQEHDFEVENINKAEYREIVSALHTHWLGNIPIILDHLVAGMYVTDKKSVWFLIMAKSDFGKSKLFKWVEEIGISAMVDFKDLIGSGITDISTDRVESKLCLVIDEVLSFHRALFKIEDYLPMRPMRQHTVNVNINSRYLLSADGGTFNNDYMDKQIMNRVCVLDMRKENTTSLGDLPVTKKYGKYKISIVMKHYIYKQVSKRIKEYEALSKFDRANKADETMSAIFEKFRQKKQDFFEIVSMYLYEILENPNETLDSREADILRDALVVDENRKGWVIKRPTKVVPQILENYASNLSYELEFKELSQIVDNLKGASLGSFAVREILFDGSKKNVTHRGMFIPFPKEKIEEVKVVIENAQGEVIEERNLFKKENV